MNGKLEMQCPFCKKGIVNVIHRKKSIRYKKGTWGGYKSGAIVSAEVSEIMEDCPVCGKSKSKIKYALEHGVKVISHAERLMRLKEAGFDGKIISRRD